LFDRLVDRYIDRYIDLGTHGTHIESIIIYIYRERERERDFEAKITIKILEPPVMETQLVDDARVSPPGKDPVDIEILVRKSMENPWAIQDKWWFGHETERLNHS